MLGLGTGELIAVAVIALVVLGPDKLPEAARKVGRVVSELRRMSSGFQAELRDAMQEPVDSYHEAIGDPVPKATPAPTTEHPAPPPAAPTTPAPGTGGTPAEPGPDDRIG